jgi:2-dehydropantoate 2-reductase
LRIAIIGAGGVGGYYGARLASAGHEVVVYARGEHLRAIQERGLVVKDHDSTVAVPLRATDSVDALLGAEWAMVAVKSYSVHEIVSVLKALSNSGTAIVPLLNGVSVAETLESLGIPRSHLLGGATVMNAHRIAPGVIEHLSRHERFVVGELDGTMSERARAIALAMQSTGVEAVATREIVTEHWKKFTMLCSISAACGMARCNLGSIRDTVLGRQLLERAVREIASVARAMHVSIPATLEADTMSQIGTMSGEIKPSFAIDIERGGPNELDVLSAAVARLGRRTGVPTPVHDTAAAVLAK